MMLTSDLKKMTGCVCRNFEKFKFLYFSNCSADRVEFGVCVKPMRAFIIIFVKIDFNYDDFNFLKNVFSRSSWRKFYAIELNISSLRDQCSRTFRIEFLKNPSKRSDFMKFVIFLKKWRFQIAPNSTKLKFWAK